MPDNQGALNIVLSIAGEQNVLNALESVQDKLGGIVRQYAGVAGEAVALTEVLVNARSALELGSTLENLSTRTGETVEDLVVLRRAFDNAGLGAEMVGHAANLLQRSLAGMNDVGGHTEKAFEKLGLDREALKAMSFRDQLQALAEGFGKIENPAQRTALAMQLFGRSGGSMLQVIGNAEVLGRASDESERLASRLQLDAKAFDDINIRLSVIKVRLQEMWVAAAEQLLPSLEKVAGAFARMNLSPIGAGLSVVPAIGVIEAARRTLVPLIATLDDKVATWTLKMGPGFLQELGFGLSGLTGSLAKYLPIGLGAAVAAEVLVGLIKAYGEWRDSIIDSANTGFDRVGKVRKAAGSIQSEDDRARVLKETQALVDETNQKLATEEDRWVKNQNAIDSYRQQLDELRRIGQMLNSTWAESQIIRNKAMSDEKSFAEWRASADYKKLSDELTKIGNAQQEKTDAEGLLETQRHQLSLVNDTVTYYIQLRQIRQLTGAEEKEELTNLIKRVALLDEVEKLEDEIAKKHIDKEKNALEDQISSAEENRSSLDADFTKTKAEKWDEEKALLHDEVVSRKKYLDDLKALRDQTEKSGDTQTTAVLDSNIREADKAHKSALHKEDQHGPDPHSIIQQLTDASTKLRESWGTMAEQMGRALKNTVGGAVDSISNGITGLIMKTTTWRQALQNVAQTILTSVVQSIVKMFVTWIVERGIASAFHKAASISEGATDAAAKAPGALMTSISSYGVAVAIGLAAIVGAMAAFGGFEAGGYTGGKRGEIAGQVHGEEFVFSAPAVDAIGVDNLEAIHQAALTPTSAAPANAHSSSGASKDKRYLLPIYDLVTMKHMQRDPDFDNVMLDWFHRNRGFLLG